MLERIKIYIKNSNQQQCTSTTPQNFNDIIAKVLIFVVSFQLGVAITMLNHIYMIYLIFSETSKSIHMCYATSIKSLCLPEFEPCSLSVLSSSLQI